MAFNFPTPFPKSGFRLIDSGKLNSALANDVTASEDNITATAGGGSTNAYQLRAPLNKIQTVATNGDSVKLPPAVAGSAITIDSDGSNTCSIYPNGSDTIEDNTGPAILLAGQDATFICPTNGKWYQLGTSGQLDNITAHSGGTQAAAFQLTSGLNRITTVAGANDSVRLPPSFPGAQVVIINDAASNAAKVYGFSTDTIDAVATATGNVLSAGNRAIYYCVTAGAWQSLGGGKSS